MASGKNCRVYVGNLAWSVDEESLENHMKKAGTVLKTQIFKYHDGYSKGCGIVTYSEEAYAQNAIKDLSDTKILDRLIFVREDREFKDQDDFRRSRMNRGTRRRYSRNFRSSKPNFEHNDGEYNNSGRINNRGGGGYHRRFPRYPGGKPIPKEGEVAVNVSNLSSYTTWMDLKDFFRQAGQVIRADILPTVNGERKGLVIFLTMADALNALNTLNDKELQNSKLSLSIQEPKE